MAAGREAGESWLDPLALLSALDQTCRRREPFSFVRLGDGEARFLISTRPELQAALKAEEAGALGELVWSNWFGGSLCGQSPADIEDLTAAYEASVEDADILGVTDVRRLSGDTGHYGYLAAQEDWLRTRPAPSGRQRLTSALNHHELEKLTPHLARLLSGLPFLGVVGPHRDLAGRLAQRFSIPLHVSYVVPAEGRLPSAEATRRGGAHFPERYLEIIDSLAVPFPGAVFLVAAGLLGKVYCSRIKQLGGVALDIGSLADAWLGFDTRNGQLASVSPLPALASAAKETVGCVSLGKTGSMALAAAMRDAGFPDAIHLHYLGPRALAIKQATPEPMLDVARQVSRRLDDPAHTFRLVASVRDPVARILSQAFYRAEQSGSEAAAAVASPEALMDWWDRNPMSDGDAWADWFDDTFGTPFGFDFREHAFDRTQRSLRFQSARLRLLVLRQGDDASEKLSELGWLLGRKVASLAPVNLTGVLDDQTAYHLFVGRFTAPAAWLEPLYDSAVVRHFYTQEERRTALRRWSRR